MANSPVLLFCVGATKASTSWLFRFLLGHPDCYLRSVKELHVFDRRDAGRAEAQIASLRLDIARLQFAPVLNRRLTAKIKDREALIDVLRDGGDNAYLDYITQGIRAQKVVADITPSYSLLSVDRLRKMAALLPDVRFVYLMRDPVARLWSHVRMSAFRSGGTIEADAARIFDATLAGQQPDILDRSDYRAAIARLDAAVDPSKLLVMFQEVMLTLPGIARLCTFLGLSNRTADFGKRVHFGPNLAMTEDQLLRARAVLRPQYEFAANRFGSLPDQWLRNMGKGVA